jgi:hypothetical protein
LRRIQNLNAPHQRIGPANQGRQSYGKDTHQASPKHHKTGATGTLFGFLSETGLKPRQTRTIP